MLTSALQDVHVEAGATLADYNGWRLPEGFTALEDEYEALTEGAALIDRSHVGRLRLTGEDALDLLNRLSTNELMDLQPGQGVPTVLTSNKGRILDLLLVLRQRDDLLVMTAPENRQKIAEWIDFYTITEDVVVTDVTEQTAMLSLAGPRAAGLLGQLAAPAISSLGRYESVGASIREVEASVVRSDFVRLPGYDLVVSASEGPHLWRELQSAGSEAGLRPIGMEALETVRMEQGVPAYGTELGEDVNPLEANLLEYISFTKGCYVGQEVVTRLNTYKKVQKSLVGLKWEPDQVPAPQSNLLLDGKRVGTVTSVAKSPGLRRNIGLGYVRQAQAQPGSVLDTESADGLYPVEVVEIPYEVARTASS